MSLGGYRLSQRKVTMIEENCENKPLIDCQQNAADDDGNVDSGYESETKDDVVDEEPTSNNVNKSDEGLVAKTVDDQLGNKVLTNLACLKVLSVLDQNPDAVPKYTDAPGHSDEVLISHDNTDSMALAHDENCESDGQCLNSITTPPTPPSTTGDCDDTSTCCSSDVELDETSSCHSSDESFSNAY